MYNKQFLTIFIDSSMVMEDINIDFMKVRRKDKR